MEAVAALSSSAATLFPHTTPKFSSNPLLKCSLTAPSNPNKRFNSNFTTSILFHPNSCIIFLPTRRDTITASSATSTTSTTTSSSTDRRHWIVMMKSPPQPSISRPEVVNYYVKTLQRVLGSEEDAQMCIYDASTNNHFGFCCDIDVEVSRELSCLPEVLSIRADPDFNSLKKDYNLSQVQSHLSSSYNGGPILFPGGVSKHWLVRVEPPRIRVITKAQVVDYFAQILATVLGNEKDAQMCIYHISWQSNYGFCCEVDDECAKELADVPGVLSVHADEKVESDNKDYGGGTQQSTNATDLSATNPPTVIKTKKLFVTGLSFYTSEKTLRAAFEGFGELVEVKIIMDNISKRSKGFAFIEYTTKEAASAALQEMNGKIINGWMIVVDVAKTNPPKYSRGRSRPSI